MSAILRRAKRLLNGAANLARGHNLYLNREKLRLIDHAFSSVAPDASSFADLGGVWRVNAAYTRYILSRYPVDRGVLVDTDFPEGLKKKLNRYPNLSVVERDFATAGAVSAVGGVDIAIFFDVLLHQANPHWDDVLDLYGKTTDCVVIYNQQYVKGDRSIRLIDLPIEEYTLLTSDRRADTYEEIYRRKDEIHPRYQKPWRDIHSVAQWGITDADLRKHMASLGYTERYFRNYGRFLDLPAFENHAFVFTRERHRHPTA